MIEIQARQHDLRFRTGIATYQSAKDLRNDLVIRGVPVLVETFDMRTSGIFIPRWMGYQNIPHNYDAGTKTAFWFFFFRFGNAQPETNVANLLDLKEQIGIDALAEQLR